MARVLVLLLAIALVITLVCLARQLWRGVESERRLKAQYPLLAILQGKERRAYVNELLRREQMAYDESSIEKGYTFK